MLSDVAGVGVGWAGDLSGATTQQAAITARGGPNVATVVIQQQVNASGKLDVNGMEFTYVQPLPAGNEIQGSL